MRVTMEKPKQDPVSVLAYGAQLQNVKMAACFMIKNPQDASIYVTGLPVNSSCPTTVNASKNTHNPELNSANNRDHSDKPLPSSHVKRYCPVLAVTRRSLPLGNLTAESTLQTSEDFREDKKLKSTDNSTTTLRENISKRHSSWTCGKPVPSSDILKSRSAFLSSSATEHLRSSYLTKSNIELRMGFMRSLSRPTPGELDLKYHRDSQDTSAKSRWGKEVQSDPDRLSMSQIMRMLKSKSAVQKSKILSDQDTDHCPQLTTTNGPNGDGVVNKPNHSNTCWPIPKPPLKSSNYSQEGCDVVRCEPPLVSGKYRSSEHKLRLQALYSQHHQCHVKNIKSNETMRRGRTWKDLDRAVTDSFARRMSPPSHEKTVHVNILSLEGLDCNIGEAHHDLSCGPLEFCSDCWSSRSSESGDRSTPLTTAALLLHHNHQSGHYRHRHYRMCTGEKYGEHRRSARPARCVEPTVDFVDKNQGRTRGTGAKIARKTVTWGDLEPSHHKISFAEYINIIQPMRPPPNSPVSIISDDEDEYMNIDDEADQWSMSYHTKGATTTARSISGLVKGKIKIASDGENKAKINVFLPQMR